MLVSSFVKTHDPPTHTSSVHALPSLQTTGVPTHEPATHASPTVHALPSSHALMSVTSSAPMSGGLRRVSPSKSLVSAAMTVPLFSAGDRAHTPERLRWRSTLAAAAAGLI